MLYIIATPIGNLKDITYRAVEILKEVDVIACEDTRRTGQLLAAYEVKKPLISLHHHSSEKKINDLVYRMKKGESIAYVSDAGTPSIADPGGKLVAAAQVAEIRISPIPGASAITALLSVAGIPANNYRFVGYVPTKKGRQTFIKELIAAKEPVVFFETAPRIHKFFDQIIEFGDGSKEFVVGRELTKQFEEVLRGTPKDLKNIRAQGEFVLVILPS